MKRNTRQRLMKNTGTRTGIVNPLKIVSVARYIELHGHRPEEDGHKVVKKKIEGEVVECVITRNLPKGEWDMNHETYEDVYEEEEVDDGRHLVRERQLEHKRKFMTQDLVLDVKSTYI